MSDWIDALVRQRARAERAVLVTRRSRHRGSVPRGAGTRMVVSSDTRRRHDRRRPSRVLGDRHRARHARCPRARDVRAAALRSVRAWASAAAASSTCCSSRSVPTRRGRRARDTRRAGHGRGGGHATGPRTPEAGVIVARPTPSSARWATASSTLRRHWRGASLLRSGDGPRVTRFAASARDVAVFLDPLRDARIQCRPVRRRACWPCAGRAARRFAVPRDLGRRARCGVSGGRSRQRPIVVTDTLDAEVAASPAGTYFLVMTHSHPLDQAVAEAILQARRLRLFRLDRIAVEAAPVRTPDGALAALRPHAFADMTCPIGIPGIKGKEPATIAVAVAARAAAGARATRWPHSRSEATAQARCRPMSADRTETPVKRRRTPRLALTGITKIYPSVIANEDVDLTGDARRDPRGAGRERRRQEHADEDDLRRGPTRPRRDALGRASGASSPTRRMHASSASGWCSSTFRFSRRLTVVENVALALPGTPDLSELAERIRQVSDKYGLPVDPRRIVHSLSVGERQRVEIIRVACCRRRSS